MVSVGVVVRPLQLTNPNHSHHINPNPNPLPNRPNEIMTALPVDNLGLDIDSRQRALTLNKMTLNDLGYSINGRKHCIL